MLFDVVHETCTEPSTSSKAVIEDRFPTNEPPITMPELSVVVRVVPLRRSDETLTTGGVASTKPCSMSNVIKLPC